MSPAPKRRLTPDEANEIVDLWHEYQALRKLLRHCLPTAAPGAWIAESAAKRQKEIIARLDYLFQETAPEVEA